MENFSGPHGPLNLLSHHGSHGNGNSTNGNEFQYPGNGSSGSCMNPDTFAHHQSWSTAQLAANSAALAGSRNLTESSSWPHSMAPFMATANGTPYQPNSYFI